MKPRLVEFSPGDWEIEEPECVSSNFEEFYDAIDIMYSNPKAAEIQLKALIAKCENIHIDAILHLGLLKNDMGDEIEGNALINKAHSIALEAIPKEFDEKKSKIEWGFMENRPFLRTFHAVGLELIKEEEFEKAVQKFRFGLSVNPNDNQGLRYLLLECYFELDDTKGAIQLLNNFKDDWSIDFNYGRVLVQLQLEDEKKALKALKSAIAGFPYGAREIARKSHPKPVNDGFNDGIVVGSKYEAYEYWQRNEDYWKSTEGAIDFVRNNK